MNHPALKHIRNVLVAALGLAGCRAESPASPEPDAGPDAHVLTPCDGAPILGADGAPSGLVRCADGSLDRVGPARCAEAQPPQWSDCADEPERSDRDACAADADCTDGARGRCVGISPFDGIGCSCVYDCVTDADCPAGTGCLCNVSGEVATTGRCQPMGCRAGEACDSGRCGAIRVYNGCTEDWAVACRTAADECTTQADCDGYVDAHGNRYEQCWPTGYVGGRIFGLEPDDPDRPAERWHCDGPDAICGRPLRIAARPRLATSDRRADWQAPLALDAGQCEALAAHWRAIAALEHASVASFARFSLQLMALGAPADLLVDCQQAAADEVEHARMAYAIASVFAGEAVGPGPLSLDGITLDVDPASVLREVIIEGCIGETLGAVEAAEAARTVRDPAIAAACARIAEDELRHAALGWRTARWLLGCHPELAEMASTAFLDGMRQHGEGITPSADPITTHGIAARPALRRATWHAVIAQLAERLVRLG